jgi:glycosyltransferase involved in cell wall biosynthesis
MNDRAGPTSLSIVVPVLNEAACLAELMAGFSRQQGLDFELVLSDGGSVDGTLELARRLGREAPFSCRIVCGPPGRGRQLNAGARESTGRTLLFLHADSTFDDPLALASGLAALENAISACGDECLAGHFALRFRCRDPGPSPAYYYYEAKACLDRPGCIHGDQGFMLRRCFFEQVGPFDESLGFLEDDRLAVAISRAGRWILLPALLATSARRFEREGLYARQVLNVLIVALEAAGRDDFLKALPGLYRQQQSAGKLQPGSFFRHIHQMLEDLSALERRQFWASAGQLLDRNIWQFFLYLDTRRGFRLGTAPEQLHPRLLAWYDRHLKGLVENPVGSILGILPAWLWFHWQRLNLNPSENRRMC